MGKRELLIVAAFVSLGVGAYYITAPPVRPGAPRFSLAALAERLHNGGRSQRGQGKATTTGTIALTSSVSEVTIAGLSTVIITGERRTDIGWTLEVESRGADNATAQRAAEAIALQHDEIAEVLAMNVRGPKSGGSAATLRLSVPPHLTARIDGARRVTVRGIASLRLDNATGDASIADVPGAVSGTQRNGNLSVSRVGSLSMTLAGSTATVAEVHGNTIINARNGAYHLVDSRGPMTIDASNAVVDATRPAASTQFTLAGGSLSVVDPRAEVRIDARGTTVGVTLDRAVPVTAIVTTGMHLDLDETISITLDAIADGGTIVAADFGLTPEPSSRGATLHHVFGARTSVPIRAALKSDGGEIVIARRK